MALSNEQKKELKDMRSHRGHNPKRRKFNKGSVKRQLAALEQQLSFLQSTIGQMLELLRIQPNLAPQHLLMHQHTLKTIITAIILPSPTNEPDDRMKGTEKLMDHLEEELEEESLSQIKIQIKTQPYTPMQLELLELSLSPSTANPTVSWTVMQTHVCWEKMHTFSWTMGRQLTLLGMI